MESPEEHSGVWEGLCNRGWSDGWSLGPWEPRNADSNLGMLWPQASPLRSAWTRIWARAVATQADPVWRWRWPWGFHHRWQPTCSPGSSSLCRPSPQPWGFSGVQSPCSQRKPTVSPHFQLKNWQVLALHPHARLSGRWKVWGGCGQVRWWQVFQIALGSLGKYHGRFAGLKCKVQFHRLWHLVMLLLQISQLRFQEIQDFPWDAQLVSDWAGLRTEVLWFYVPCVL